jgi:hypothetical protein
MVKGVKNPQSAIEFLTPEHLKPEVKLVNVI